MTMVVVALTNARTVRLMFLIAPAPRRCGMFIVIEMSGEDYPVTCIVCAGRSPSPAMSSLGFDNNMGKMVKYVSSGGIRQSDRIRRRQERWDEEMRTRTSGGTGDPLGINRHPDNDERRNRRFSSDASVGEGGGCETGAGACCQWWRER